MEFTVTLKDGTEFKADFPSKAAMAAWLDECGYMRAKPVPCGTICRNKGNAVSLWFVTSSAIDPVGVGL